MTISNHHRRRNLGIEAWRWMRGKVWRQRPPDPTKSTLTDTIPGAVWARVNILSNRQSASRLPHLGRHLPLHRRAMDRQADRRGDAD